MSFSSPLVFLLLSAVNASPPNIAHCRDHDGTLIFTDPPCPVHSTPIDWQGSTMSVLEFAPSPQTKYASAIARQANRSHESSRAHEKRKTYRQECKRVKSALKKLRGERRRGYRLADAAKLDDQLNLLKAEKRKFC